MTAIDEDDPNHRARKSEYNRWAVSASSCQYKSSQHAEMQAGLSCDFRRQYFGNCLSHNVVGDSKDANREYSGIQSILPRSEHALRMVIIINSPQEALGQEECCMYQGPPDQPGKPMTMSASPSARSLKV